MTLKNFLESEGIKPNRYQLSKLGKKFRAKANELGIKVGIVQQVETFNVADYPEDFIPKMKKIWKEHQAVVAMRKKQQQKLQK